MGLVDDLKVFIDIDSDTFVAHPTDLADVASKWGKAFGDAFEEIIGPSRTGGLLGDAGGTFQSTLSALMADPSGTGLPATLLGPALDAAAAAAAGALTNDNATLITPPTESLGSDEKFLKGNPDEETAGSSGAKVAADAEARFTAWVKSGKYIKLASSTSPVPNTALGS